MLYWDPASPKKKVYPTNDVVRRTTSESIQDHGNHQSAYSAHTEEEDNFTAEDIERSHWEFQRGTFIERIRMTLYGIHVTLLDLGMPWPFQGMKKRL